MQQSWFPSNHNPKAALRRLYCEQWVHLQHRLLVPTPLLVCNPVKLEEMAELLFGKHKHIAGIPSGTIRTEGRGGPWWGGVWFELEFQARKQLIWQRWERAGRMRYDSTREQSGPSANVLSTCCQSHGCGKQGSLNASCLSGTILFPLLGKHCLLYLLFALLEKS